MKPNSDVMDRIVYDLASVINTPRALSVWLCYKYNHQALLQLPATDFAPNAPEEVKLEYFIHSYLKKYKGLSTGIDLQAACLEKWNASEVLCGQTNVRFRESRLRGLSPRVEALLFAAQRKIAMILGSCHLPVLLKECKWSSGSTFDIPLRDAKPDIKMTRPISVTESALPVLRLVMESDPHWFASVTGNYPDGPYCVVPAMFCQVRGNKFWTVPKDAKTDRAIGKEPTGNAFLQQGTHAYLVRRLKRFGIDLGNQTRNQLGAQRAYTELFATLDLSAASDSISRELVYELLPIDWALYLDTIRSRYIQINGEWRYTEKFVSMGNAFCFELETLIFYALARAVCGEDCTIEVYGDDIIVPAMYAAELTSLLSVCGFELNVTKSYASGNFYESCGEHYHMGQSITPVYQKEPLQDLSERIRAHNRLIRFGLTFHPRHRLRRRIEKLSKWMISNHPGRDLPQIPYGTEGDDGYLVHPFRLLRSYDKNHGYRCRVFVWCVRTTEPTNEYALLAYKFRRPSYQNSLSSGAPGHEVSGHWVYKTRWIPESDTLLE